MIEFLKKILGCKEEELENKIKEQEQIILEKEKEITSLKASQPKECQSKGKISYVEAYNLLTSLGGAVFLSDEEFNLANKDDAKRFTEETKVAYVKWINEDHDCDNFSFASMGYWSEGLLSFAYGIAWSKAHAFNFLIDENKEIWIVEPQTNEYMTIKEAKSKGIYFPIRIMMM